MRNPFKGLTHISPLALLYVATGLMVLALTAQRSFYPHDHWTFWIFRASFWHLLHQQDLYARYGSHDLFKYSPSAAVLFAPFAFPSYALGLLLWNALNAVALIVAIKQVAKRNDAVLVLLLVLPELFVSTQASQCNALIAALIVLAFVALEKEAQLRGYLAIATGVAIKLFPIAALSLALFHPRRFRAALVFATWTVLLLLIPLLVTSPTMLLAQYGWWHQVEGSDALLRGASVMRVLQQTLGVTWPNWPVQLAGIAVLLLPLLHRDRWADEKFRRAFLASLLVFVVLFNHQAERPSYIIAATGVAIWFADSPRDRYRLLLVLLSLTGLRAWGYLPVWMLMQLELHGMPFRSLLTSGRAHPLGTPLPVTAGETHSLVDAASSETSHHWKERSAT
jgi:Glycosyltransferase family 87